MISVEEALARVLDLVPTLPAEEVPLREASGRVLARSVAARLDQPPFRASIMDGYALRTAEAGAGAVFRVVGEAAAGRPYHGACGPGEAVRIFTGAPVPEGLDRVIIQEDVAAEGALIRLGDRLDEGPYVRPRGADFHRGQTISPRRLRPADIALLAAMNHARVPVVRRPVVAIIMTGDELVMPGVEVGPGQIVASNGWGLAAMIKEEGAEARVLPIARDDREALRTVLGLADGADLVLTIGGASVGEHDLVARLGVEEAVERDFYKVAMRPGKPLMAGRISGVPMVGLPGNPVSAMVCGIVFVLPAIRAMLGLGRGPSPRRHAPLAAPLEPNGPREHYMRAVVENGRVRALPRQDSALLSVLAAADALIIRPPRDPARDAGHEVQLIDL